METKIVDSCVGWGGLYCFVFDWQTLIAGILAVTAAAITILFLYRQIKAEARRHKEVRRSAAWAARATLPDALSAIWRYAEARADRLIRGDNGPEDLPESSPPIAAIQDIKSAIEYVDAESAKSLFGLVVHYQIHESRFEGYKGNSVERRDRLYDTTLLLAMASRTFRFARNEEEVAPVGGIIQDDMLEALRIVVGLKRFLQSENQFDDVEELIRTRHPEK